MGNIVLLDELTINKIAAGEVIERPASVIKEMIENSIDAGAKNITVEIKNGGISFIRITDNGKGIEKDDMEIAFERHATSKIRCADDLIDVKSMGFRGEALASIAAISNVELVSRTVEDEIGTRIVVEGGKIQNIDEIGCSQGTTITVRNLFFNTPVRYKFLKKDFTESGYIEDVITRIALIHPEISFKFINTGKTVIQTNGNGEIKSVIYSIFGKEVASNIIEVDYEYEKIRIKGVIGKPQIARSNRSNQIFFVNERYIKDKTLSSAVEQAFKGMLPIGKFAYLVLNVILNPASVDVNVHPAKLEVRFSEENLVFKAMFHAVKDTLLQAGFMSEREKNQEIKNASRQAFKIKELNNETMNEDENSKLNKQLTDLNNQIEEKYNNITNSTLEIKENNIEEIVEQEKEEQNQEIKLNNVLGNGEKDIVEIESMENKEKKLSFDEMYKELFGKEPYGGRKKEKNIDLNYENNNFYTASVQENNVTMFEDSEEYSKITYKFIGIAFNTYIILEIKNELYIMDQHAAHERIMYEKVKKNFYEDGEKVSQLLLLPDLITLTHKEMEIAKENLSLFQEAGFILEEFGENTIKLSGVPDVCIDLDTAELFKETLDEINTVARTAKQEKEEKFIATVACKAAVKANMKLSKEEVDSLMNKLLELPNPFTCPHGRPTVIKMSKYEIERNFSRK